MTESNPPAAPQVRERVFDHRDRLVALMIVLLLLGAYWFTMGGHTVSVDGEGYLAGTRALARHTTVLEIRADTDGVVNPVANKNGDPTLASPIGTLLLFLPGYLVGRIVSIPFPLASQEDVVRLFFLAANSVMTAITGGLLYLLCRLLYASRRASVLLAFAFGLGTWAWPHSQSDFSEPGTAMVLTAATIAAVLWWRAPTLRRAALVGLLAGSVVITRSSTLLFVPIFLAFGLAREQAPGEPSRLRQALAFALGGLGPALLFAVNAYVRFGSVVDNGYPNMSYSTPIYEGVFGLFLSPGKGLLWYAPVCIVSVFALRRSFFAQRRYVQLVGALLVAHLAVYARFQIWSGENAFGPRYLVPVLPLLVALVAPVIDSGREWLRGVKVAAAIGFLVPGLLGSLMYFNAVYMDHAYAVTKNMDAPGTMTGPQRYIAWNFQPRSSPLMLHVRSLPDLFNNTVDRLQGEPGGIKPVPAAAEDRIHWYTNAIELDFWWAWWSAKGLSRFGYIFLIAPAVCIALGVRLLRKLRVSPS
ncbi:MAG: hypothetical protein K8R99_12050 [Actinomycetia bacterium]|nr:hypothetical protein [Actinomycetes bacterium]